MSRRALYQQPDPTHDLLEAIERGADTSQRSLAKRMGIALGLTNLLVRRFVGKGWVRVMQVKSHRVRYLLTPEGVAEKARLSQQAFRNSVDRYRVARTRIQSAFDQLSADWALGTTRDGLKPVVFYGTGEIAEIGYICLQDSDLQLVAAIDDHGRERFFDVPVVPADALPDGLPPSAVGAQIVVMSLASSERIRAELASIRVERPAIWI